MNSCQDRIRAEGTKAEQLRRKGEEVTGNLSQVESQVTELDRKCKFLEGKLSELRNLSYVITERRGEESPSSASGNTLGKPGFYAGGGAKLTASGLPHEIKAKKALPTDIAAKIERITTAISDEREKLEETEREVCPEAPESSSSQKAGASRSVSSSEKKNPDSEASAPFGKKSTATRAKNSRVAKQSTASGVGSAPKGRGSGLPTIDVVRAHFGADHPAHQFYVHLLPLLKGIAVMLWRKDMWVPRIVSVSTDYQRLQFHSETKVVAESFIRVASLKSVNVPDPTLRLLQDVAAGTPIPPSRPKLFQIHVLRFDSPPLRLQVPTITTLHLLTQGFKIICETPKEQLAYYAVVLGLKTT
ncbi:unnamed protein product [Amoebophrya sp. A25]|nr:unnamed protein product [Amoebophrya sp. A25]|eukprot:GSA25T00015191001.1